MHACHLMLSDNDSQARDGRTIFFNSFSLKPNTSLNTGIFLLQGASLFAIIWCLALDNKNHFHVVKQISAIVYV